jgi:DNA-binding CsgD family transcriptional regulator
MIDILISFLNFLHSTPGHNPEISVFMPPEPQVYQQLFYELLDTIPFAVADDDYSVINKYIHHLEELDRLGKSAVSVFDLFKKTHVYTSISYKNRLGLSDEFSNGLDGFERIMHPDDRFIVTKSGYHFMKMVLKADREELRNYKLIYDFRIRTMASGVENHDKSDINWIRMTEQQSVLEFDKKGNPWLALSIMNISPDQNSERPGRSRLINQITEQVIDYTAKSESSIFNLSVRETEILRLISKGLSSKQIADKLFISVHTVNTHRQNIISKMNVSTTTEAIGLMSMFGAES